MKVFFSHCGRDKAIVRSIFPYLPEHVRKWYDESDLKWGENVDESLRKAILDDVDFVVVFLSNEALKSKWVTKELHWALEKEEETGRIFVLPVLLEEGVWDKVEPEHFKKRKHLKFFEQTHANTMALASELTNQLFAWLSEMLEESKREKKTTTLTRLYGQYQLAIISSTSESLIEDILSHHKILKFFSTILGKYGPRTKWEHTNDKAHQLIRLSNLTGIPLDRTVFIADNNSDFKSARQLGVKFIEARIVAEREKESLGNETLIDYPKNDMQRYFTSYGDKTLEEFLAEMNHQVSREKYRLDQKFLPEIPGTRKCERDNFI